YYNGTAVRVLGENGDWLHVSVYGAEGWMMKRYLARSEAMNAVTSKGPTLSFVTYPALLYESPKSEYPFCKLVGDEDCFDMYCKTHLHQRTTEPCKPSPIHLQNHCL
ncbi:MAG: SH3 domain-containing protein, partial [Clostridia bacterium]